MNRKSEYIDGFRKGIPIGLGYLPVSFTFGVMAVAGGIPVLLTVFTSVSNLTSAGQFAGAELIFASAGYFEIALTTFVHKYPVYADVSGSFSEIGGKDECLAASSHRLRSDG